MCMSQWEGGGVWEEGMEKSTNTYTVRSALTHSHTHPGTHTLQTQTYTHTHTHTLCRDEGAWSEDGK